jgi:alpha-D-xyloside xylohydrolase
LKIDGEGYGGQMDYFFIAGPALTQVIDRYTQLTGRPRLPQKSLFGLLLSDKSDPDNNGEPWWKMMITNHRNAGFAVDHQVNDNAWRASNEAVSGQQNSWFEFRKSMYPDPAEYKQWCDANGITVTLDLNRPGIPLNPSWNPSLSITGTTAQPDFTNVAARQWIWQLFFTKALDPALKYPGDAIWLDEFDYPDLAHSLTLSSGKRWAEESINYHLDLQKACVKEGWDVAIGEAKRPYFWSRGITAGAQRWGNYWTGDLDGNWGEMTYQVRAMQSAGVSGFPYFNHDAGGHLNVTVTEDNLYRQWDMGFGSFTPIWKPHGPSHKRWPLQRNQTCQDTAKTFITTRYQMLPYIYSYAHVAQATGMPMVRPMFLEDQNQTNATAWSSDLQYLWGHEMVVAPNLSDGGNNVSAWLPAGSWYYFWDDRKFTGGATVSVAAATGVVPAFVRAGAIIPMAPFAKSTFFIAKDNLIIHAYTGADGQFSLYEDDGVTEKFRTKNELQSTALQFTQQDLGVQIGAAQGTYAGAPTSRAYQVVYHGLSAATPLYISVNGGNGTAIASYTSQSGIPTGGDGAVWDAAKSLLNVYVAARPVGSTLRISTSSGGTGTGGTSGGRGGAGGAAGGSGGRGGMGGVSGMGGAAGGMGGTAAGAGGASGSSGAAGSGSGAGAAGGSGGPGGGAGGSIGGVGSGTAGAGGDAGSAGTAGATGNSSGGASGAPGSGGSSPPGDTGGGSGCSCDVAPPAGGTVPMLGLLLATAVVRSMRRRRR